MRQFRLFGGIAGYDRWMKTVISINKNQESITAQYRLSVLQHYWKHGLDSTVHAFPVSRPTLFRWQDTLKKSGGCLQSLVPHSTRPRRVRQMCVSPLVINKIKALRTLWPNLSKHKLKPLLDVFCMDHHERCISATTIGEVMKRHGFFSKSTYTPRHDPHRKIQTKPEKTRVWNAPKQTMGHIEVDLVETRIDQKKKYTVCWIDIGSKVAFSRSYPRKTSTNILDSFLAFEQFYPGTIHTFQTDNGSEFEGAMDLFLRKKRPGIKRQYIPVRSPKVNGVIERYNRSLQEDWLNHHLDLFHNTEAWDKSLGDYIHFYNYQRIHDTLHDRTPMQVAGIQKSLICP